MSFFPWRRTVGRVQMIKKWQRKMCTAVWLLQLLTCCHYYEQERSCCLWNGCVADAIGPCFQSNFKSVAVYIHRNAQVCYLHSFLPEAHRSETEILHRVWPCTPAAQQQNGTGAEQACVYKRKQPKCNELSQPVYCKEMSCNSRTAVVWRLPPTFAISLWLKVVTATSYSQSTKKHQCDVC